MARRTFDVIDICEIFTHWHAGRSKNELAGSLGLSRNTVRKYVAAAEAAGMVPGGPAVSQERWAELAREWFPELADARLRQVTWPAIEAHRDYIVAQLKAGVTMATIHQRLADERGLAASVASLRRYVAANLPEEARRAQVTVLRLDPPEPGQEAQVDYGQLGRWAGSGDRAAARGECVRDGAVLLAAAVRPPGHQDGPAGAGPSATPRPSRSSAECPARLVPDNLKTGVDRPDLYDPRVNRSYAELAAPLRLPGRPRPLAQASRQAAGRAADAVYPGLVLARPGVHQPGADAGRGGALVRRGGGAAVVPAAGRRRPGQGVRRGGEADAGAAAGRPVRARAVVAVQGRPRHPREGRPELVLGAVEAHRPYPRCPVHGHDGAAVQRRGPGQDARPQAAGQADRPGRLPISYVESRTGQRECPLRSGR